jgi:LPXTG-motif cell wall-anchored protein
MRALAAAFAGVAIAVLPATAALAADPKPDIAVSVTADKPTYAENAPFTATATVTNKGSVAAVHVHFTGGNVESLDNLEWGALATGFDLAAGATKIFTITGKTTHTAWRYGHGGVVFTLEADNGEANDADNTAGVSILVPGAFGTVIGQVCPGENLQTECGEGFPGVPGIKVVVADDSGKTVYGETVTDAKGKFSVAHVPAGDARVTFTPPPGWQVMAGENGTNDFTFAQVIEGPEPATLSIIAKQVPVPSTSAATSGPAAAPSSSPGAHPSLPITGSNTPMFVAGGLGAVVVGVTLVLVARRRRIHLQS